MRSTVPALFASALLLACTSSHSLPCDEPTLCTELRSGCCLTSSVTETCGACPRGTIAEAECGRSVPMCDGDLDAGPGGCVGPIPLCHQGWSGSTACCLEPGTPASCIESSWQCPRGSYLASACGRIDSICEGIDAGPGTGLYDDCGVTSDCVLVADSCCGVCGQPERDDVAAVNVDRTSDYYLDVACPEAREGDIACPACAGQPNPHLAATCDQTGTRAACTVVDLSTPTYASCTIDADCRLAAPGCCRCGEVSIWETIAVRNDVDINPVFCDFETPCPPCFPTFDPSATARCDAGRCIVDGAP